MTAILGHNFIGGARSAAGTLFRGHAEIKEN